MNGESTPTTPAPAKPEWWVGVLAWLWEWWMFPAAAVCGLVTWLCWPKK